MASLALSHLTRPLAALSNREGAKGEGAIRGQRYACETTQGAMHNNELETEVLSGS